MKIFVNFKRNRSDAIIPKRATERSAGMDLHAAIDEEVVLHPGQRKLIPTGLSVEMQTNDTDYLAELQVRPRSGLAFKKGITVLNSPGTVDEDYRGDIGVILHNASESVFTVKPGDRIAQAVISTVPKKLTISITNILSDTERGEGGFGSTGISK